MNYKKLIAVITTACFLVSFVFGQAVHAAVDMSGESGKVKPLAEEQVIGQSIGRVTDFSAAPAGTRSNRVIVNIQDLHCHAEVQRNIAKILSELDAKYGLKKVYVEGAYGDVDTSWLCNIKDKELKETIIENLINEGKLTGSEYYSVKSNRPGLLKGIEDRNVHEANIVRLGKILDKQEFFNNKIKGLEKDLQVMEAKYFNSRNKRFNRSIEEYKSGKMPAEKFYRLLCKYARNINSSPGEYNNLLSIDMNNYPNISGYLELMELGRSLKYPKISGELSNFVQAVKRDVPYGVYNDMAEKTDNFSKLDELYVCLSKIAGEYRLDIGSSYPDLKQFFDYNEKSRGVNPIKLIEEQRRLVEEIRVGFANDIGELEVSFLNDFFGYFKDYVSNKISADDYGYFVERFGKFKDIWSKYAFRDRVSELSEDFTLLNEFYDTNCKRNECFVKNITELKTVPSSEFQVSGKSVPEPSAKNTTISGLLKNSEIVVIVTGGFHTQGLKKIAEDKGLSYITITPNISQSTKSSSLLYAESAKEQAKILEENAQFRTNSLALAIASELKTDALVRLMSEAARHQLSGSALTQDKFDALVKAIKDALGENNVKSASFANGTIELANNRTINITREETGGTVKEITFTGEMKAQAAVSVNVALNVLNSLLTGALDTADFGTLCPNTYSILKNLFMFAERENYVTGYGLIHGIDEIIKNNPELRNDIEGIPLEDIASLPDSAQNMILARLNAINTLKNESNIVKKVLAIILLELTGLSPQTDKPEASANDNFLSTKMSNSLKAISNIEQVINFVFVNLTSSRYTDIIHSPSGLYSLVGYLKHAFPSVAPHLFDTQTMNAGEYAQLADRIAEIRPKILGFSVPIGATQSLDELILQLFERLFAEEMPLLVLGEKYTYVRY